MTASSTPPPALRPLVRTIWASDTGPGAPGRERVLPTGDIHLVLRLADRPLRLFDGPGDDGGRTIATAVIGGARTSAYLRAVEPDCPTVGVLLAPGACRALVGLPAAELAGRHVALADIWPAARVALLRERLAAAPLAARPGLMAALLVERAAAGAGQDRPVLAGLEALRQGRSVAEAAAAAGLSRRQFGRRFLEEIGLSPRDWLRTRRFDRLLHHLHGGRLTLAEAATASGYADQPHMAREFARIAGLTPAAYRRIAPSAPRHVPLAPPMSQSFKTGTAQPR